MLASLFRLTSDMEIQIGEYKLRPWRMDDVPALTEHANNKMVADNLRDTFPSPYTEKDAKEWILHCQTEPLVNFAIATKNGAIGNIGAHIGPDIHRYSAEVGYWIGESYWNKGVMTLALKAFSGYAFDKLGMVRLYATVFEWNPASARVLEKAGYSLEGRLRKYVTKNGKIADALLYALVKEDAR